MPTSTVELTMQTLRIYSPTFIKGKSDGINHMFWKFKIIDILDSYDILEMLMLRYPKPQPTFNPSSPIMIIPLDVDLLKAWGRKCVERPHALIQTINTWKLTKINHLDQEFC
ncbi:hypothetical protein KP509_24G067500 [Ceratopteris richardii]|uniref:Uncharacterized protein n=1 Tax=Ceratopteris richardii TaxID=49495 RepID=A0A8T2RVZ6_CERRI|nr:hypothetical protein KP509_24G067500 [Ceratopteris richardii]